MRFHKKWSGPLRRVELDPEPPVKSGRPAPAFRLSRSEPKSAAGHAHGPSDSGTRRFSIGSKDRRVQHLRCRPTPDFILAKPPRRRGRTARTSCAGAHSVGIKAECHARRRHSSIPLAGSQVCLCHLQPSRASIVLHVIAGIAHPEAAPDQARRCALWSRRACRIHGRQGPCASSWGVAPVFRETVSDAGLRSLGGGAALPPHANGAMRAHRWTDCLQTPRERATAAVDSPRFNRATAANRRASSFFASRRL